MLGGFPFIFIDIIHSHVLCPLLLHVWATWAMLALVLSDFPEHEGHRSSIETCLSTVVIQNS